MFSELISVIIPVYNAEKTIERSINSVLQQTIQTFELILVDDGSTDKSGQICTCIAINDERIRYIKKENGGVSTARNLGIKEATGKYITLLDSDDWFELNTLEKLLDAAYKNNADIVIPRSRMYFCKSDGEFEKYVYNDDNFDLVVTENSMPDQFEKLRSSWALYSTCGRLYKKEFLEKNLLHFDTRIKVLEDFCFNLACLEKVRKLVHISDVLYNFYVLSITGYAYKRKYQDYIISNEQVYDSLKAFNERFHLPFSQGQYDFIMSYWVQAINSLLYNEKNRRIRRKQIKVIIEKVFKAQLYEKCSKEYLDRQYIILFKYKSVFLFLLVRRAKQLKKNYEMLYRKSGVKANV